MDLMGRLRSKGGCPWDLEQTHESLKPYVLEEAYEVLEAIDSKNDDDLKEELGDLLLQVVFHARIADETERFNLEDVAQAISEKLVRRHPHVFGDISVTDSDEVLRNWETIKAQEKKERGKPESGSALDGVQGALPALIRAFRIQQKAARTGFEWSGMDEIARKIQEELAELVLAIDTKEEEAIEEELGDLLFAVVAAGRYLKVGSEEALRRATTKFTQRFKALESELARENRTPSDTPLSELEAIWERLRKKSS